MIHKSYRGIPALILAGFLLLCPCLHPAGALTEGPGKRLVVLHTNDHHGHPLEFYHHPTPGAGGLPARATLVQEIRKNNPHVLLLDAGDLNTGRPESDLFRAEPDIRGYNAIGYDAMALGNHEFDRPLEVLRDQMALARFPFLSANVLTRGGRPLARPYIIKDFGAFKCAVFGLTLKETRHITNPAHTRGLSFEDEVETASKLVPMLRKKADMVIALVHLGLYDSPLRGSRRLAALVEGIDLIVDGHSHSRIDAPVLVKNRYSGKRVPIVQAWKWGLVLGRVDLTLTSQGVTDLSFEAIPINVSSPGRRERGTRTPVLEGGPIAPDPRIAEMLEPYLQEVNRRLGDVIGEAQGPFSLKGVRRGETALGDLVADAMKWYTRDLNSDFALQNAGGIRAGLPKGAIKRKAIHAVLPFDNTVRVLDLTGEDLQALFEHIGRTSAGSGAFPQVSRGVAFRLDPATRSCLDIRVGGMPIDPRRVYKVATNSYLANGGDGYRVFAQAPHSYDTSKFQRDTLIDYIGHLGGVIRPEIFGRIAVRAPQQEPSPPAREGRLSRRPPRGLEPVAGSQGAALRDLTKAVSSARRGSPAAARSPESVCRAGGI